MNTLSNNVKVTTSGYLLDITVTEKSIVTAKSNKGGRRCIDQQPSDNSHKNRMISIKRSVSNIKHYLAGNFHDNYRLLILSFSDHSGIDVTNLKECIQEFNNFKRRLQYFLDKHFQIALKYLGVIEFQEQNNREAIHFHIVTNMPFIPHDKLSNLWKHGHLWVEKGKCSPEDHQKLSSYLTKGIYDERLDNKHRYLKSTNLLLPVTLRGQDAIDFLENYDLDSELLLDGYSFNNEFLGECFRQSYWLKEIVNTHILSESVSNNI